MKVTITPTFQVKVLKDGVEVEQTVIGYPYAFVTEGEPPLPFSYVTETLGKYDPQWVSFGIDLITMLRTKLIGILFATEKVT